LHWLYFALGFLAFPLIGLLFLVGLRFITQVEPTEVTSGQILQSQLRNLLDTGKHGDTLFIVWLPMRFELRVHKRIRKSKPDTLWLELRNSDTNRSHYTAARSALDASGIEFAETLTQARKRPRRLHITWPSGGPLVVSAASHAISIVQSALPSNEVEHCLASPHHPSIWSRRRTAAV